MSAKTKDSTKGKYDYPVDKEYITRISYCESPKHTGSLRFSVDFIVPVGTPVKAASGGRVVDTKADSKLGGNKLRLEKYGNFVEIYHPECDEYSEYEHLSKTVVKPGDTVKRGQLIGYSGATGYLGGLGPHLHFMVGVYKDYHTLKIIWRRR